MVNTLHPNTTPLINSDEFLPPISRWTAWGGLVLMGTIGLAIGLSAITRYNVAIRANAVVRPAGELRVVQAETEGTVKQIQVRENQTVRQGDVIAYLDDARLQIQKSQLQGSIQQNQLQLSQLDAQVRLLDVQMRAESASIERTIASAQVEISRNQRELQDRQTTSEADFQEAMTALELARDQFHRNQQLAAAGAISQSQLKERETAVRTAAARVERARAFLQPSTAIVAIAQQQVIQQQARGEATLATLRREQKGLLQRRSEIQNLIIRDQKELEQVNRSLERSTIRATSDGVIFQFSLTNANQVVRPGDNIAQIAPANAPLLVKATVANQDVDDVAVGQAVQIRVNACPYTDYGTLEGAVRAIAPDAGTQSNTGTTTARSSNAQGNARTFEATIELASPLLVKGSRQCQIHAGMEGTANIISREETFLQFVLRKLRLTTDL